MTYSGPSGGYVAIYKENPYLKRKQQAANGAHGTKAEKKLAKRVKGRATVASGSKGCDRGDVKVKDVMIEAKATKKFSISVTLDWLAKVCQEARQEGKVPALSFMFVTEDGCPRMDGSWVAIPEELFRRLLDAGVLKGPSDS